jgi:NAD(P)-dependent dehydrogenase (short-subunit alcohol dehydrogenase family)
MGRPRHPRQRRGARHGDETPSRAEALKDPAALGRMLERIPTGRFPTAEEVAAAVVYLASPGAASVTGHTLVLDGGTTVC